MRAVLLALLLIACTGDAKEPPPLCADVGCGSAALCTRNGNCTCPQPDGHAIACVRVLADAGAP